MEQKYDTPKIEEMFGEYPRTLSDLQGIDRTSRTAEDGGDLRNSADPGLRDDRYQRRKRQIMELSSYYKLEDEDIPLIEYTKEEIEIWKRVCWPLVEI